MREEKKRTFEFETLVLPPLKMILVESEIKIPVQFAKKKPKKRDKPLTEETVLRIIEKLIAKE